MSKQSPHKTAGFIFWIRHARHIKPPASRIPVFKHKKTNILLDVRFKCWRQPIVPGRCQPSIFSTNELNFCVRYGNRWTLVVINTNYSVCRLIWRLCYNTTSILKLQAFFQKKIQKVLRNLYIVKVQLISLNIETENTKISVCTRRYIRIWKTFLKFTS